MQRSADAEKRRNVCCRIADHRIRRIRFTDLCIPRFFFCFNVFGCNGAFRCTSDGSCNSICLRLFREAQMWRSAETFAAALRIVAFVACGLRIFAFVASSFAFISLAAAERFPAHQTDPATEFAFGSFEKRRCGEAQKLLLPHCGSLHSSHAVCGSLHSSLLLSLSSLWLQ